MPTIVQITDTHVFADPAGQLLGVPTWDTFAEVLALADAIPHDRLVLTGDLAQDEDRRTYEALAERLGDRPLSLIPGNHDDPAALAAVFPDAFEGAGRGFAEVVGGWLLIGFDSHVAGQVSGTVGAAQCALAEERLAAHPDLPVVFFVHHPPAPIGADWLDAMGLVDSPAFDALVQTHAPRIQAVVCGHVHQDRAVTLHGVPVFTTPSTAFQFAVGTAEPGFDALPPGLRVLELGESLQTRVVRLDRQEHAPVHPGSAGY